MAVYRAWQAILSVLALGCFLALDYMRGMSVPSMALVICSWVAVVAPVLLAISWVVKKRYIRTIVLAALVAAIRISLEDTLSQFMRVAAWFLIGAIVLALIIAVVVRVWRRGKSQEPDVGLRPSDSEAAAVQAQTGSASESKAGAAIMEDTGAPESAGRAAEAPAAGNQGIGH